MWCVYAPTATRETGTGLFPGQLCVFNDPVCMSTRGDVDYVRSRSAVLLLTTYVLPPVFSVSDHIPSPAAADPPRARDDWLH